MMRTVSPGEAGQVFDLMGRVYSGHSFLDQGVEAFQAQLEDGGYVSIGSFDGDGTLQAHAGYRVHPDFALMNALVVNPDLRGAGLGRAVFQARLDHIKNRRAFDFVVGYSMMQHLGSQKLYPDDFKPIGVEIGYPDIYHQEDTKYNQGDASNAEIVLCQRLSSREYSANIAVSLRDRAIAQQVLDTLGVSVEFHERDEDREEGAFLGFHPDTTRGLFVPAFLGHTATVDFGPLLTSTPERGAFIDMMRENYERSTSG